MNRTTAGETRRALTRAIVLLTERRGLTENDDEREEIEIELPKLEQKRERIHQLIIARRLSTIAAPTSAQVQAIADASRQLDGISANNTTATAVLALVRAAADVVRT